MTTERTCAYCGRDSDLTNEHVFPECFNKTFDSITTAKTPAGEKAVLSDLKIHDVCGDCNNGPLSRLDAYLCTLNDKYFSTIIHSGDCVHFVYEFDRLLRVLLKIGYNVARARKWPLENWRDAAHYIRGTAPRPSGFRLFLQLMIPTPLKDTRLQFPPEVTEVPPLPMRVYLMKLANLPGIMAGYMLSVWSYRFFVFREDMQASRITTRRSIGKWLKNTRGSLELDPRGVATIYASSVTVLDDTATSAIFLEQLSLARELKSVVESKKSKSRNREV
jgi:hypothetical protein